MLKKSGGAAMVLVGALVLTTACSPRIEIRGHLPDPERMAELEPGQISRDEVLELLGSPSSTAMFEGETWYYISERTETTAFFKPDIVDRRVVVLRFDQGGVLREMSSLDLSDGYEVNKIARETPTAGNEMTFIQQMFGNIGRFSDKEK